MDDLGVYGFVQKSKTGGFPIGCLVGTTRTGQCLEWEVQLFLVTPTPKLLMLDVYGCVISGGSPPVVVPDVSP